MNEIVHPVQQRIKPHERATVPEVLALRGYEVYCALYGKQPAVVDVDKGCRGGFSVGELLAFLYARSFPKEEWRRRVEEAQRGMTVI